MYILLYKMNINELINFFLPLSYYSVCYTWITLMVCLCVHHVVMESLDTTLCDKVCLAAGQWLPGGTLVSSTNKTYCHDITEILLKVA